MVASVEPEVIPESISSKSDQSQELFSSSSTKSSPANSEIDSELSSDKFESKSTSSSRKKLVLAKKTLSTYSHHEHSGSSQEAVSGFRFIDLAQLASLAEQLVCPQCHNSGLVLQENLSQRKGLCSWLDLVCFCCQERISFYTSLQYGSFMEVNRRSVFAAREIGCGRERLRKFCSLMNMPPPVAYKSYNSHVERIFEAAKRKCQESMHRAQQLVKKLELESGQDSEDGIINTAVSCDGTWHKRGFSSLYGATFVIAEQTGQVLDYDFMSKTCSTCRLWAYEDQQSTKYKEFWQFHKDQCQANYSGTSPGMDAKGAVTLWSRSLQHGLRYLTFIGDGDSKAFENVTEAKPYGAEYTIQKSDCIGHIQKRMGTNLRNKKKEYGKKKLSDGRTIGGAGRLTEKLCDNLQRYYGQAIRDNLGDLDGMVKATKAVLHHSWSTDDEPDHGFCPVGATSWCKFQRANALGETPPAHHTTIPKAVGEVIKPVFDRLCDRALLKRCLRGSTQNPNESLHATIWERCPKQQYVGPHSVETAICLAVINFNDGAVALDGIMQEFGLMSGYYMEQGLKKTDTKRLYHADRKHSLIGKKRRKKIRNIKKGFEDAKKMKEGETYLAGGFD